MKYPVGPITRANAAETDPGKLAALLNQLLYEADFREVVVPSVGPQSRRIWGCSDMIFKGSARLPSGMKAEERENYVNPEVLMRAIRDYLEFCSFAEVIP
jgi:hypothetical protein